MKKLMIAAFAVAFAAVAQAAAIKWTATWAVDSQANDLATGAQAYLIATAAYTVEQATADLTGGKFDAIDFVAKNNISYNGDMGSHINIDGIATELEGSQSFYMVLLNGAIESATEFMIVDPITVVVKSTGSTGVNFGELSDADTYESLYAWSPINAGAIPEPTSALMLLVGLAGLALRRKQA